MNEKIDGLLKKLRAGEEVNGTVPGKCPEDTDLLEFAGGRASREKQDVLLPHINSCPECSRRIAMLARMETAEPEDVPSGLSSRVKKSFRDGPVRKIVLAVRQGIWEFISGFEGLTHSLQPAAAFRGTSGKVMNMGLEFDSGSYLVRCLLERSREGRIDLSLDIMKDSSTADFLRLFLYEDREGSGSMLESLETDPDGRALFSDLSPGSYILVIGEEKPERIQIELLDA